MWCPLFGTSWALWYADMHKGKIPIQMIFNGSAHLILMELELRVSLEQCGPSLRSPWVSGRAGAITPYKHDTHSHSQWLSWKWLSYWFSIYHTALCISGVQAFLITGLSSYYTRLCCITPPRLHQKAVWSKHRSDGALRRPTLKMSLKSARKRLYQTKQVTMLSNWYHSNQTST